MITWQLARSLDQPTISFDNYLAARTATEHLVALGHRKIGLVCGRTSINDRAFERRRAYEECLGSHGIELIAGYLHECEFDMFEGRTAMSLCMAN